MPIFQEVALHTKRCVLRPWQESDIPLLPRIANTRDISWNTSYRFPYPFEEEQAEQYVAQNTERAGEDSWQFAVLLADELIGGCGATRGDDVQSHTAVVGYWLGVDYWGMGLATEALEKLIEFMRDQTDIEQLTATGYAWNATSPRVLEKNGFSKEGIRKGVVKKWGRQTDLWIYGKTLR